MKHYLILKYGRVFYEKIYEMYGDEETARNFLLGLSRLHSVSLILVEVI